MMNEIRDALSRNPDEQEYKNFLDYVSDMIRENDRLGKKTFLVDIAYAIMEYRNDNYNQCEECGEWIAADSDEWNHDRNCCRNCHDYDDVADYYHDDDVCNQVMGY
jgi:formylmethanofuran dehydrogenase subunit E